MNVQIILLVGGVIYTILAITCSLFFDKITNPDNEFLISTVKYHMYFFWLNILCLPFIKRIKRNRKIEYLKHKIELSNIIYGIVGEYAPPYVIKDKLEAERYLKLEQLKNKNRLTEIWTKLSEMVKK